MNTLQLSKIKQRLLQEIGDASAKDLPTVSEPKNAKSNYGADIETYKFAIDKEDDKADDKEDDKEDDKIKYGIKIVKKKLKSNPKNLEYYVLFGVEFNSFDSDMLDYYKEVNNPKSVLKVISVVSNTVKKSAIKDMVNGYKIKQIKFSPVKDDDYGEDDTRREKLYFAYIANALGIKNTKGVHGSDVVKSKMSQLDKSGEWTVYIPEDYYFGLTKEKLDSMIKKKTQA
jgi:hypothetical protein